MVEEGATCAKTTWPVEPQSSWELQEGDGSLEPNKPGGDGRS